MRKTALSTRTTNSRGVKSSFSKMTLYSLGRSVFVLPRGLSTVSAMPMSFPQSVRPILLANRRIACAPAPTVRRQTVTQNDLDVFGDYVSTTASFVAALRGSGRGGGGGSRGRSGGEVIGPFVRGDRLLRRRSRRPPWAYNVRDADAAHPGPP